MNHLSRVAALACVALALAGCTPQPTAPKATPTPTRPAAPVTDDTWAVKLTVDATGLAGKTLVTFENGATKAGRLTSPKTHLVESADVPLYGRVSVSVSIARTTPSAAGAASCEITGQNKHTGAKQVVLVTKQATKGGFTCTWINDKGAKKK